MPGVCTVDLAFELGEHLRNALPMTFGEQREATAVGHADHDFLDVLRGGAIQHFLDHARSWCRRLRREALVAFEAILEEALEAFREDDVLEDALLLRGAELPTCGLLNALPEPNCAPQANRCACIARRTCRRRRHAGGPLENAG